MSNTFFSEVKSTIEEYKMLSLNDVVVAGVSGGPDSIALLHILYLLKEKYNLTLFVVHLNHMLRGEEARNEAQYVASLAEEWGLNYKILERDIMKISKEKGLSIEEAGHRVRHEIFRQIGQEIGATRLALGHHADDRAETVLIHLIQGTGLEGLASMPPSNGWIIRPLAKSFKKDIINYCQANHLHFYLDQSNEQPVYLRNKVRLNLLPYLKTEFNPRIVEGLLRLEDIVVPENQYLEMESSKVLNKILIKREEKRIVLNKDKLMQEHLAIQRRVIRKAYSLLRTEEQGLSFTHVEGILDLVRANQGLKQLSLPQGVIFKVVYNQLELIDSQLSMKKEIEPLNFSWDIPGSIRIGNNKILKASFSNIKPQITQGFFEVILDGNKIASSLKVRRRKPGDRLKPLGMKGTKKVKDIFIDRKIPKEIRDTLPIVCSGEDIIWLPGITINEDYKADSDTKCFLKLEMVMDE
jgi:tRNA(Ile)-lysidine synthase